MTPKKLTLKKFEAGGHGAYDEQGNLAGVIDHKHLMAHARRYQQSEGMSMSAALRALPTADVDARVVHAARAVADEEGISFGRALVVALSRDRQLAAEYSAAHGSGRQEQTRPREGAAHGERARIGRNVRINLDEEQRLQRILTGSAVQGL